MIISLVPGRLGNQIFHYSFIHKRFPDNQLIFTKYVQYFELFHYDKTRYRFFSINSKIGNIIFYKCLQILKKFKIFNFIEQKKDFYPGNHYSEIDDIILIKGLFSKITIVEGYFQSEKFIDKNFFIKNNYLKEAKNLLQQYNRNDSENVLVHIRKGDYVNFKVCGQVGTDIPLEWFHSQIKKHFLFKEKKYFFIFTSDEPDLIEKEFSYLDNYYISRHNVGIDFSIMSLCENAILSPSSLSRLGMYVSSNKKKIIAPKYWLGYKSSVWFPRGIETDFITYEYVV